MRTMGFALVAFITSASQLLACSSGDTVVAANLLSSNDTQYNGDTHQGSYGGLLDPGIPENILHPDNPLAPRTLRKATMVRITITQGTMAPVTKDVVAVAATFQANVLDAQGMPVMETTDAGVQIKMATHSAIGQSYERFTLPSSWSDGQTQVTAEAIDSAGPFFSAVPATIDLKKGEVTAAFLDFKIPSSAPAAADGGTPGDGGTAADGATPGADGGIDATAPTRAGDAAADGATVLDTGLRETGSILDAGVDATIDAGADAGG